MPPTPRQDAVVQGHLLLARTRVDYISQFPGHGEMVHQHPSVQGGPIIDVAASVHSMGDGTTMNMLTDSIPVPYSSAYGGSLFPTQIGRGPLYQLNSNV